MNTTLVEKKFESIGARVKIGKLNSAQVNAFTIDIKNDKKGEFYEILSRGDVELLVQDVQRDDRHLVLFSKTPGVRQGMPDKRHFLCGHDERHFFCATLPKPVSTVAAAKQSLKPPDVVQLEGLSGVRTKNVHKRHKKLKNGRTLHRQGEFFFIPEPSFNVGNSHIHKNEPMSGGGGHSHCAQELVRSGGEQVYVRGAIIVSEKEFKSMPRVKQSRFISRFADARVHVRGKISHVEHKTCDLGSIWHRVQVNTESRARARGSRVGMGNMFLD